MQLITLEDIRAAAVRIEDFVVRTPLLPAPWGDPERPLWPWVASRRLPPAL